MLNSETNVICNCEGRVLLWKKIEIFYHLKTSESLKKVKRKKIFFLNLVPWYIQVGRTGLLCNFSVCFWPKFFFEFLPRYSIFDREFEKMKKKVFTGGTILFIYK